MSKLYIFRDEEALPLRDILYNSGNLYTPNSPEVQGIWTDYTDGLGNIIETTLPNHIATFHSLAELAEAKTKLVKDPTRPTVTADKYDIDDTRFKLRVSRHFMPGGSTQIGVFESTDSASFAEQLISVKKFAGGLPVNVIDDDVFTGETAAKLMNELEKADIPVAQFIAGIQIARESADPRISTVHMYDPSQAEELTDPRDFLLNTLEAGAVIRKDTVLSRAPYISPFVDVTERASVPKDKAATFSNAILDLNIEVYEKLTKLVGKPILVEYGSKPFMDFLSHVAHIKFEDMTVIELCKQLKS